jgi:hypothetical protein
MDMVLFFNARIASNDDNQILILFYLSIKKGIQRIKPMDMLKNFALSCSKYMQRNKNRRR